MSLNKNSGGNNKKKSNNEKSVSDIFYSSDQNDQEERGRSYKVKQGEKGNSLDQNIEDVESSPHQHTGATYHPLKATSYNNDKVVYRRTTKGHPDHDDSPVMKYKDSINTLGKKHKRRLFSYGLNNQYPNQYYYSVDENSKEENNEKDEIFSFSSEFDLDPAIKSKNIKGGWKYNNPKKIKTQLDDDILDHKTDSVRNIVNLYNNSNGDNNEDILLVDENQLKANYPCVIVRFNENNDFHKRSILDENNEFKNQEYANFITHVVIAHINKSLIDKGQEPLFDKRDSFGFLTPAGSNVMSGVRLSLGLVPNKQWEECVVSGIREANDRLNTMTENLNKEMLECILSKFHNADSNSSSNNNGNGNINNYAHKMLLDELFYSGRYGLNLFVKELSKEKGECIEYEKKNDFFGLVYHINKNINMNRRESSLPDNDYLNLRNRIFPSENENENEMNISTEYINSRIDKYRSESLMVASKLDTISETSDDSSIDVSSGNHNDNKKYNSSDDKKEDSSSDDGNKKEYDNDFQKKSVRQKNYSPSGMSALYFPLVAFHKVYKQSKETTYKLENYSYFELPSWGWNKTIFTKNIREEKNVNTDVVFIDNNPCVNRVEVPKSTVEIIKEYENKQEDSMPKLLIVDDTSSTKQQREEIIEAFKKTQIPLLVFASSGIKNQQLGLDNAQFGKIRTICNPNVKERNLQIEFIKQLRRISKNTLPVYSRYVIRDQRRRVFEYGDKFFNKEKEYLGNNNSSFFENNNNIPLEKGKKQEDKLVDDLTADQGKDLDL